MATSEKSRNLLFLTDSYKVSHYRMYPPGTTKIVSYFESRGGRYSATIFFGLTHILKKWLTITVTQAMIDEAEELFKEHFGVEIFNRAGWQRIVDVHAGKLPLEVRAVPEGSLVPTKNALFTVTNTDDECAWLVSYVETVLEQVWYPTTVATNSFEMKRLIAGFMDRTCDKMDSLNVKVHDFGFRGCTSVGSAGIAGCAHLVSFRGSDNLEAIVFAKNNYPDPENSLLPAISCSASEHSTMTAWGKDREEEAFRNLLKQFPIGMLSVVVDSYDLEYFVKEIIGRRCKEEIQAREGVLVVRPDSGKPEEIVVQVLDWLGEAFPPSTNSKGFKVLPPFLRIIQGDGISLDSILEILESIVASNWSVDNITFGSGGALLQKFDRDTARFAYKACYAIINREPVDVFKDPVTDPSKRSKAGNLCLVRRFANVDDVIGQFKTVRRENIEDSWTDAFVDVFRNGELLVDYTLSQIRDTVDCQLQQLTQIVL